MCNCNNCGKELGNGAKFCAECGAPTSQDSPSENTKRKVVYEGEIHKCPRCGEELQGFVAICPSCGHELNSQMINESLKSFINAIDEVDDLISKEPSKNRIDWKSWSIGKKVLFLILTLSTYGAPLLIYFVFPMIMPVLIPKSSPRLSEMEKKKANLIENFTFPNERESIIEALIFTKSKIAFLSSEQYTLRTAYWSRLWLAKAQQLFQKAKLLLKNDSAVNEVYEEILRNKAQLEREIRNRAIAGFCVIFAYVFILSFSLIVDYAIAFSALPPVFSNLQQTDDKLETGNFKISEFKWPNSKIAQTIPKSESNKGKILYDTTSVFSVDIAETTLDEFNDYIDQCLNMGFDYDYSRSDTSFYAKNKNGYSLVVLYSEDDVMHISIDNFNSKN